MTAATGADPADRAARPLTPAARRVLEAADELFYSRGINTVGMDLVAERAGVTKKTVYDRFGSKAALVAHYLRARDARWRAHLEARLAPAATARERVAATFDALEEWVGEDGPRGCSMVNAYAELADPDHPGRAVAREQKRWLRALYTDLARESGARGPEALGDTLTMLHEGAVLTRTVTGVPDAVGTARAAADALLTAHGAP
ncbi:MULTISPECIES: TetR/AcrR family transcriptional regulator [Nocardiopsis]|uniref:TetR/AcrR family transcriptional regulator n=1 Tax=Nocardiopsis changdeensis TaxID=2831969 RepID=A0ABX8BG34_9ACTN|nr:MULTISPECIES: TetR/AcrR family transcriptional regulator [Nocardiopsis]QUX21024.1 TetR/AcrR family transcriptional regulator [Nocardiopsis changdeensis]QYX36954.1 TetR/AcrR family transcriptional regulator [Nocardiopsis sp. MT53]